MLNYEEAVGYLISFADFERSARFRHRPDVAPVLTLLAALGNPHLRRPTIHVAGSNGKGSTAAMIESILRTAGYSTGLYTSPHLHDYTERIRINHEPVSREVFASLADQVREAVERTLTWGSGFQAGGAGGERSLVTFDLLTAMGFLAFRDAGVDVQVIEVGLGGRVDSTNVFKSKEVAVITNISLEHTAVLGDTIELIAAEKAGIVTPGCTAVIGPQRHAEAAATIRAIVSHKGAHLVDAATTAIPDGVVLGLRGAHQGDNARAAIAAVRVLDPSVSADAVASGLLAVRWPARFEVLCHKPVVIADGAHNQDSARALREALAEFYETAAMTLIIGASADKDISGLATELAPIAERVYAVRSSHPRSMEPGRISRTFRSLGINAEDVDTVGAAIERAMAACGNDGVICLTGSLFVAAEGRDYFGLHGGS